MRANWVTFLFSLSPSHQRYMGDFLFLMLLQLTAIFFFVSTAYADSFTTQCFVSQADHAVSNAHPIAELFRVTSTECLNYCIVNAATVGDGCASVVFHREYSTCQLYSHDGQFNGSEVVPVYGHDFFKRRSWIGACQDKVVPKRGYQQRPKIYGVSSNKHLSHPVELHDDNFAAFASTTQEPLPETTIVVQPSPPTSFDNMLYDEEDDIDEDIDLSGKTYSFLNPTHSNECGSHEKIGYFILFGYKLSISQKSSRLNGVDQSSCIMYCSQNINALGEKTPCFSANYDPIKEKCQLYGQQPRTNRKEAVLTENKNYIFADKFCLKTKKDCSAESPFIVYPYKQMHKKIVGSIPRINSVVACVAFCIDHGSCQAVTYKEGLCILHGATPATDASLLVDGTPETLVVENGCQLTASAVPALISNNLGATIPKSESGGGSPWEEWSACQFGLGGKRMRVRQRECSDCEDLQIAPCY